LHSNFNETAHDFLWAAVYLKIRMPRNQASRLASEAGGFPVSISSPHLPHELSWNRMASGNRTGQLGLKIEF